MISRDEYDRVTSVLAPFGGMDKIDPKVLARAAARGPVVHSLCQGWIDGIDIDVPSTVQYMCNGGEYEEEVEMKGYVESFIAWAEGKEFLRNPGRMYCDTHHITGECDGLLQMDDGQVWLFDLKTSASESCTWKYQSAAYTYLLKHSGVKFVDGEVFVRLSKEGKKAKEHIYTDPKREDTFFSCLETYRIFYKKKQPLILGDL